MREVRVGLAQIDTIVGDFEGNIDKIVEYAQRAASLGADIVLFPELAICGYPPEDLLLQIGFLNESGAAIDEIARRTARLPTIVIVGFPEHDDDTYNSAAIIYNGRIWDTYRKIFLPNYGVFDERRYFSPGERIPVYDTPLLRFGVNICEDIWQPEGPAAAQSFFGNAKIIFNINASPYTIGKPEYRENMISSRSLDNIVPIAYLNCVGGQDELVFDGQSFATNSRGEIIARASAFEENLLVVDFDVEDVFRRRLHDPRRRERDIFQEIPVDVVEIPFVQAHRKKNVAVVLQNRLNRMEEIWQALVCGLSDYIKKNNFKSVILGLSGGIDSALVATIAADAVGAENVHAVFMPTKFTAEQSLSDAEKLAKNLKIDFKIIEIEPLFEKYIEHLKPHFANKKLDITEENIQSRIRGNILMALSNKFGHLVLATGNKSEMSVGYATLYGDMVGGFAVIKDVPKTLVWELARWKNKSAGKEIIPKSIIERPPTAELRENQLDTDSLPPYEILDKILELYISEEMSIEEILLRGDFDEKTVRKVAKMVDSAEYKRRQAPPGIKITTRAFGKERRMPITRKGKY
ncbi:NAD+ synthase [bacterium]|nr:NAD+ synthase [bacterium]